MTLVFAFYLGESFLSWPSRKSHCSLLMNSNPDDGGKQKTGGRRKTAGFASIYIIVYIDVR